MKENKNNEVVKYILENYDIKNANDIADALKDMFKDTIQTMMLSLIHIQMCIRDRWYSARLSGKHGAEAKASLNRANKYYAVDPKPSDLAMSRLK